MSSIRMLGPVSIDGDVNLLSDSYVFKINNTPIAMPVNGSALVGDGETTEFTVEHNTGTTNLMIGAIDLATNAVVVPNISEIGLTSIKITFTTAPDADQYKVMWLAFNGTHTSNPTSWEINFPGIAAVYAPFNIKLVGSEPQLTEADIGKAVGITDDYEVGLGSAGGKLLGRLQEINTDLNRALVQIAGIMRLSLNNQQSLPGLGHAVVIDGSGKVYRAPSLDSVPAGGQIARGFCMGMDTTVYTCDLLLK
jgi:hypothetical protein